MTHLSIQGLRAGYGDIQVLDDVSIEVFSPGITAVIGSNGAGKTTLLRALSGLIRPSQGSIVLGALDLAKMPADEIVSAGLVHVPEGRRLFAGMTVEDNLLMGAYARRVPAAEIRRSRDAVYAAFPRLAERRRQDAVSMSGGEQQMCAIGRGMMADPRLMMIDELSLGLAPVAVDVLVEALKGLAAGGLSLLVVEQDVAVAFDLASRIVVLDRGRVTRQGPTHEIASDPAVREAYLGAR